EPGDRDGADPRLEDRQSDVARAATHQKAGLSLMQYSVKVRDDQLDAIAKRVGPSPFLQIRSGPPPDSCLRPHTGELLCEIPLPAKWMDDARGGAVSSLGEWKGQGVAAGMAGHFRIKNNAKTIAHIQGTVSSPGGDGDAEIDNAVIAVN